MKKSAISIALAAILTGTSQAAINGTKPAFMDKHQLAEMRSEAASNFIKETEDPAFFTGKPYLASVDGYAFKYRSYSPVIARWNSEDPSGFPDGANNSHYAPVPSSELDFMGLWTLSKITSGANTKNFRMTDPSTNSFFVGQVAFASTAEGDSGNYGVMGLIDRVILFGEEYQGDTAWGIPGGGNFDQVSMDPQSGEITTSSSSSGNSWSPGGMSEYMIIYANSDIEDNSANPFQLKINYSFSATFMGQIESHTMTATWTASE